MPQGRFSLSDLDPPAAPPAGMGRFRLDDLDPPTPQSSGLLEPGNINLARQPRVANPAGGTSTVYSSSYNIDGAEVLLPAVAPDGRLLQTDDEILGEYTRTGRHLGKFSSPDEATAFASQLHDDYAAGKYDPAPDFRVEVIGELPREAGILDRARDVGISALKGAIAVPEAAVGLLDIPTGGRVGRFLEETVGFQPDVAKRILETYYSDPQRAAFEQVAGADGLVAKAVAALSHPSVIAQSVIESAPSMLAGGVVGRAARALPFVGPAVAGAIGEATVSAGAAAEQTRQQSVDRLLTPGQSALAATTGAVTGTIGAFSGKLAQRLGIADVDTMLAGAAADATARKGLARQVVEGAVTEGFLEEFPQSVQEQVFANQAQGRDLLEGVDDAAVMGALAGATMGGGANVVSGFRRAPAPAPPDAAPPRPTPVVATETPAAPGAPMEAVPTPPTRVPGTPMPIPGPPPLSAGPAVVPPTDAAGAEATPALGETAAVGQFTPADVEGPPEEQFSYGSTQVNLPEDIAAQITALSAAIPDEDLAEDGRETEPHVTVQYGLEEDNVDAIRAALDGEPPITVTFGRTSLFSNDDADVVKVDVESDDLRRLRTKIAQAVPAGGDTHPTYQPHATVAYVKPGRGAAYADNAALEGQTATIDRLVVSGKDGGQIEIPLTGAPKTEGPPMAAPVAATTTARKPSATPFDRAKDDTRSRSIDASPAVRQRGVNRDQAFLMRWLADDLQAMSAEPYGRSVQAVRAAYETARPGDEQFEGPPGFRGSREGVAGTPTQAMFKALGVSGSRNEIAMHIDRFLMGDAKKPSKAALAAQKLAPVFEAAWDGQRFDFARVSDEILATAGIARADLRSPVSLPTEEQPADLVERYLPKSEERRAGEFQAADIERIETEEAARTAIAEEQERALEGAPESEDASFDVEALEQDEPDDVVRARTLAEVDADPDGFVDRYLKTFGRILNADNASELFRDYNRSPEARAKRFLAVRPAAARVVEHAFERILREPAPPGRRLIVFTSGGNASGKSTFANQVGGVRALATFDSTLSQLAPSVAKIEQALAAGFDVDIRHVSRDPVDAWRGVLDRAMTTSKGRAVTMAGHAATHRGARETLLALADRYATDPRVTWEIAEAASGRFVPRSLDWLRQQAYPKGDGLRADLRQVLDDAHKTGAISDAVYAAAQGQSERPAGRPEPRVRERQQAAPGRTAEAPVDTLDTGEAQPRLPDDVGQVRDVERPTPTEDLPEQTLELRGEQIPPQQGQFRADEIETLPKPPTKRRGPSGGGTEASVGDFANLPAKTGTVPVRPGTLLMPAEAAPLVTATTAAEFPELVLLARQLAQTPSVVKTFRTEGVRGTFREGEIRLHANLFKQGNEGQLAATLAHEMGHLVDWLPDKTLKRGNLLGHLRSLQSFLKHTFTSASGDIIGNTNVKRELQALSDAWRPWDPATASPSFAAYRRSAKELYADAISVLLNNPGLLEAEAPTFYRLFFEELDRKPEVRRAYFDLQELLSGTREQLIERRRSGVREMFEMGDAKAIEIERLRQAEVAASRRDLWARVRIQQIDKNIPLIDRVKALQQRGVYVPEDEDPRYFLEERNYIGGRMKAFTEAYFQPVYASLVEAGITWHDFGEALFYERIAAGDRSEVANPRGIAPAAAQELLEDLTKRLTAEQRRVLARATTQFRAGVAQAAEQAYKAGLYKPELYAEMKKNPAYVTFRVIDYLERDVTSRVHHQVGTLKDVTNPADATILKTLVTLRAIEYQRMKVATFDFLEQHYPDDIEQAKYAWSGKGMSPLPPPDPKKQVLVTYYEAGKLRGKYVDPYIADSLNNASVGQNWAAISALRWFNSKLRPIYTSLNLGFQSFNFARDFARFWKNAPQMTLNRALRRYLQAVPLARVRAFGISKTASASLKQARQDLMEAEAQRIFSITFNDMLNGRQVEDTQIEDTLAKVGIGAYASEPPRTGINKALHTVLEGIRKTGDFIETLPKAAAIYEFTGKGSIADITPAQRSFIRRKLGSPDYLMGGTFKPITNELLLFSNAITQAWRADLEVARDPQTRAGWWFKTAAVNVAPKLALFAALYLLPAGDDEDDDDRWATIRRALEGITEYDLTNYLPIPVGVDEAGNTIYIRLPQDDAGRLVGGITWKVLQGLRGDREAMKAVMQVLDYTAGQVPSVTPILQVGADVAAFAAGKNVYDPFRSRFLFTDDELKAQDWRTVKKFLGYEFQQLGGGIVWKFYPGETRPREQSTAQKILDLPVLSTIAGRWVRITNYGKTERLRETQAGVQRDEARTRLDERAAVSEALQAYRTLAPPNQTRQEQLRLARDVVQQLYADAPAAKRAQELRDVLKKIRMGAVRGKADPIVDAVMSATSTAQKVAIVTRAAGDMSKDDFVAWLRRAQQEGVVSADVAGAVRREIQKGTR